MQLSGVVAEVRGDGACIVSCRVAGVRRRVQCDAGDVQCQCRIGDVVSILVSLGEVSRGRIVSRRATPAKWTRP